MEIKCTVEEFKELIKNTSVAETIDVNAKILTKKELDNIYKYLDQRMCEPIL